MKTDKKTVGFGGGITNARTVRPKRCAAPVVQMRRCENARMAAAALLGWLCDLVGWWLLIPLYIVVGRVLWRVIWS